MKLTGHLDRLDKGGMGGWILDSNDPTRKLTVQISRGATLLAECLANLYREDLAKAGIGDGHCAFKLAMDLPAIFEGEPLCISVPGTDYYFPPRVGRLICGKTAEAVYRQASQKFASEGGSTRRFRKCILHMGTEKTGSTSIQSLLGLNRLNFAQAGIFTPELVARNANPLILKHDWLAALSMAEDRFDDDLRQRLEITGPSELESARESYFHTLARTLGTAPPQCDVVLLSDEHCHSRLTSSEEIANLKDLLDHFADSYQIVVYLRPQHELAISQYGMFVANGLVDGDMLPPLPPPPGYSRSIYTNREYFDYESLLNKWQSVFGAAAIKPRIYQGHKLTDGDVIKDFATTIGLPAKGGGLTLPERKNRNISARAQRFLIGFNQSLSGVQHPGKELLRQRMRNAAQYSFSGNPSLPLRQQAVQFYSQFKESNERVRQKWFSHDQALFDVNFEEYPEHAADTVVTVQELMSTFVTVMLADQELRFNRENDQARLLPGSRL